MKLWDENRFHNINSGHYSCLDGPVFHKPINVNLLFVCWVIDLLVSHCSVVFLKFGLLIIGFSLFSNVFIPAAGVHGSTPKNVLQQRI